MVEKAKHHIREGDIFQIVLSNRLSTPFEGSLFNTYRVLRTINPSPYMFYFSGTDVEVAGASLGDTGEIGKRCTAYVSTCRNKTERKDRRRRDSTGKRAACRQKEWQTFQMVRLSVQLLSS